MMEQNFVGKAFLMDAGVMNSWNLNWVDGLSFVPNPAHTIRTTIKNIADSGVMFTIAAGNYGIDARNVFPANKNHSNVYTLSAFDQNDNFATAFSDFGNPPIDYSDPGVEIINGSIN